jgi:hypothetical protein
LRPRVGTAVDEIAAAVKKQGQGMIQNNTAVGQMDKVTSGGKAQRVTFPIDSFALKPDLISTDTG